MDYEEIIDPTPIPYSEHFSKTEFEQIQSGFMPRDMDDKWVIRFETPYLRLHRSWNGLGVYRVKLAESSEGGSVVEAVCAKAMLANSDLEHQSDMVEFLIGNLVLKRDIPFPNPKNLVQQHPGLYQHVISGTGYSEKGSIPKRPWWKLWR